MSVTVSTLQGVIARALALRPVDRSRIEKAAALIAFGHVEQIAPDAYRVRSQTNTEASYRVTPTGCQCVTSTRRPNDRCKHEWSVRLLVAAEMAQQLEAQQDGRQRAAADSTALAYASAHRVAA